MSRKSLVPIVLPADPTQPLEAATKQYVDAAAGGGGAEEVAVQTSDPGAGFDLWYDTDDVLTTFPMTRGRVLSAIPTVGALGWAVVTVAHGLGAVPASVICTPYSSLHETMSIVVDDWDATNFVCAFYTVGPSGGTPIVTTAVSFSWVAMA